MLIAYNIDIKQSRLCHNNICGTFTLEMAPKWTQTEACSAPQYFPLYKYIME